MVSRKYRLPGDYNWIDRGSGHQQGCPNCRNCSGRSAANHFHCLSEARPHAGWVQMSDFLDEVLSHLQALPDAEVNLSVEVDVKATNGIDDATARFVLENSRALKVDNPQTL